MSDQPLKGLVILDLSQGLSGPFCTKWLADFGAEVIKIEPPEGDPARRLGPFLNDEPGPDRSGTFLYLNTSKKSVTLNVATSAGASIFHQLAKHADVVIENFAPGALASLGLDYPALEAINPALVMTSISYFGQDGPYCDFKGSDMLALAMGGLMYVTGSPDREPLKVGGAQAELQAGINAATATMVALAARDLTGVGQHVDVAVVECITSIMEATATMYSYVGKIRTREGARHHNSYPSTILPCRDGYVHVHGARDGAVLAQFVDEPRLLAPELMETPRQYADEIDALVLPWLSTRDKAEILEQAQLWRLPFAMVCGVDELLDDPQLRAREFFVDIDHPETGRVTYPGAPFRFSETPWRAGRAPSLGEHNDQILGERLGYSQADLTRLRQMNVI